MQPTTNLYPHILGGVYGQALGDAWAMPAHFHPDQTWTYYNGWLDRFWPASPDHPLHAGFRAGQITDDTQQALALAEAIMAAPQLTVEEVARAMVAWYEQGEGPGAAYISHNTHRAMAALKSGSDPHLTGLRGDTDGGAKRVSPIGLIHPGDPDAAVADAIIACTPLTLPMWPYRALVRWRRRSLRPWFPKPPWKRLSMWPCAPPRWDGSTGWPGGARRWAAK
ncbi:MAG: hypothetical protein HC875_25425 [Anaerolineales bacterium]|nr:hypothetical protein [Anaerolineales bacterium]